VSDWHPFQRTPTSSAAESLIGRRERLGPKSTIVIVSGTMSESEMATYNLACRFAKSRACFRLRAIVEDWSRADIVREMN
jgi:hypothetical protein